MLNIEETYVAINNYLLKLQKVIEKQATFTWFKTKFVPKKRIDDLLCCIEGSFPSEYKEYIKTYGGSNLTGYKAYQKLLVSIRRKALLSSETYSIKYEDVIYLIKSFQSGLKSDLKKVCESDNNMF
jgi:hypothetical protein